MIRPNAIEPYTWRAEYRDGSGIAQFQDGRLNPAAAIDRSRLRRLIIDGHRSGPLVLVATETPDEVILRARTRISFGATGHLSVRTILVGFRFGLREQVLELRDPADVVRAYIGAPITADARAAGIYW